MLTRPIRRTYSLRQPTQSPSRPNYLPGGGVTTFMPPGSPVPMMQTFNGGFIPAAQDPTDPSTWRVPVVFT
jgi:hypothetical protein